MIGDTIYHFVRQALSEMKSAAFQDAPYQYKDDLAGRVFEISHLANIPEWRAGPDSPTIEKTWIRDQLGQLIGEDPPATMESDLRAAEAHSAETPEDPPDLKELRARAARTFPSLQKRESPRHRGDDDD
jgi:hypothetical protein